MQDQWGNEITVTQTDSEWVFTRAGLTLSRPSSLSQEDAASSALGVFNSMVPEANVTPPAPQPDPNGFGVAVLANSSITLSVRLLIGNWIPSLILALQAENVPLIEATWPDLVAQYGISSDDRAAVAALAAQYNIPGISA